MGPGGRTGTWQNRNSVNIGGTQLVPGKDIQNAKNVYKHHAALILLPVADQGVEGWMTAPHFSYKMFSSNDPSGSVGHIHT